MQKVVIANVIGSKEDAEKVLEHALSAYLSECENGEHIGVALISITIEGVH